MEWIIRFWKYVDKNGPIHPVLKTPCWLWTAYIDAHGYGKLQVDGGPKRAHRLSWFLKHGEWPNPYALHKCDVRNCVNPDHLFEGTHRDNADDRVAKGRTARQYGSKNGRARLSEQEAQRIRL